MLGAVLTRVHGLVLGQRLLLHDLRGTLLRGGVLVVIYRLIVPLAIRLLVVPIVVRIGVKSIPGIHGLSFPCSSCRFRIAIPIATGTALLWLLRAGLFGELVASTCIRVL